MSFRITGLDPAPFVELFDLEDRALEARGIKRYVADSKPGFPDRIELRDAEPGESVLLLNYTHQPARTPYRASHAIFVREGARTAYDRTGEIPQALRSRVISLRAFDADHLMVDADLMDGRGLEGLIERFFEDARVRYLHAHYAKRGCYAARIERA
ncbi:MAG TPA: DUF1203 domain-containing protein [Burkholderiaceae bacterium]|jgi:hypothetical protein|nr:DUF1203 domain-containing protein [Burkholderiaceae bacterium]